MLKNSPTEGQFVKMVVSLIYICLTNKARFTNIIAAICSKNVCYKSQ